MDILVSPLLERFTWIEHGFGTRHSALSQEAMVSLRQIHSSRALLADRPTGCVGEGDALITNRPGRAVSVRTADCFPILLVDGENRVVAAVHAGWRGTAARIAAHTIEKMRAQFRTEPVEIYAAIGPGIGECCYEVGPEVAGQFGLASAAHIDLAALNRRQLLEAGVPETQLEVLGGCTACGATRFHSFRRDKQNAGRLISYIRIV